MLAAALVLTATVLAGCTASPPRTAPDPVKSPAFSYDVFPPTSQFGDSPRATLRNTGEVPFEYRHDFLLEALHKGVWRTVRAAEDMGSCNGFPDAGLVLHPGDTTSQRITACGGHLRPVPLFAGRYRVTKTLHTIPSEPGESPVEIYRVVEFEVAEAGGDVPDADQCRVLCISDTHVEAGQTVRVSFAPPRRYSWGVPSELHAGSTETVWPIAYLTAWLDRDEEIATHFIGEPVGWEDIGFSGAGSWRWEVPERLEPGIYTLVKSGIAGSVRVPIEERTTVWTVSFEVEG